VPEQEQKEKAVTQELEWVASSGVYKAQQDYDQVQQLWPTIIPNLRQLCFFTKHKLAMPELST
jgi:hypothetical protein